MLTRLFVGMLLLAFNIQSAKASGTIYIRDDRGVDPADTPIFASENVTYTFNDNIIGDGAGYASEAPMIRTTPSNVHVIC